MLDLRCPQVILIVLLAASASTHAANLPPGFNASTTASGFDRPVGIAFASDGRMFVAEQCGRVWVVEDGITLPEPLIDLSEEVNGRLDRGLLGIALDPDFLVNRYIYLLYTVDSVFGEPDNSPFDGSFSRLTRYTCTEASNGNVADLTSRFVLIGTTAAEGIPICEPSHSIGSLRFGTDGSLLLSAGDGAHYDSMDDGGQDPDCFKPGMFPLIEDIGAFRSQYLGSLAGKVLRVDPATGLGLPENPYFTGDAADNQSRVWAYGLRNPFRFTLRPNTGSTKPGDPGTLYIGDVGWFTYEEINVAYGGENFGWPCKEGFDDTTFYVDLANPAHSGCDSIGTPTNPGPITDPLAAWHHNDPSASTPPGFQGACAAGTAFYTGACYPKTWHGTCFIAEYSRGWIKVIRVDENDLGLELIDFATGLQSPVDIAVHPHTGDLHYVSVQLGQVHRISYETTVSGDIDGDCVVDVLDLLTMLSAWGPCSTPCPPFCTGDINGDCSVNVSDLLALLANWG